MEANGGYGSNVSVRKRWREGLESAPSCQCSCKATMPAVVQVFGRRQQRGSRHAQL